MKKRNEKQNILERMIKRSLKEESRTVPSWIKSNPKIHQAVSDIISYETLPSQIDYRQPWKIKANKAEEFIESLSPQLSKKCMKYINQVVGKHYDSVAADYQDMM